VLLAEILLRQTRAASVPPVLDRLLDRFPTPSALAAADADDVFALVRILGFGRQRTAQLKQLGHSLLGEHRGVVPRDTEVLRSLPGIGPYSAAMIAASCFGAGGAAVDTNVARVLCRVFALEPSHAEARKSTNVWHAADRLTATRPGSAAELTWALVDLAAAICKPRKPLCAQCPLVTMCAYAASGPDVSSGADA
jgi:A/G-specific adenine glycosylase